MSKSKCAMTKAAEKTKSAINTLKHSFKIMFTNLYVCFGKKCTFIAHLVAVTLYCLVYVKTAPYLIASLALICGLHFVARVAKECGWTYC